MATGYTEPVRSGKSTSFREFALQCARAFGANVIMRDEPWDAPIREYKVDAYYENRVTAARRELAQAERMKPKDIEARVKALYAHRVDDYEQRSDKALEEKRRYQSMLDKVKAWKPPTTEHVGLQQFMVKQLEDSMEFDCGVVVHYNRPSRLDPQEWYQEHLKDLRSALTRAVDGLKEERERVKERNEWNQKLMESLK